MQGAEPIAVLSYGLWQELGGDAGRDRLARLTLDGTPRTVVGVMPRGFWYPDPAARIWLPQAAQPRGPQRQLRRSSGRLAPGEDAATA